MEDKSKNSRILFPILSGHNQHVLVIVIVGHLLTEYLLDKIITVKFKNPNRTSKESFSKKLKLLYPDWLPLFIYRNIKLLDRVRNDMAHNLGAVDYEPIIYIPKGGRVILDIPKRKNKDKFYFRELVTTILFDLVSYSFYSLNIPDEPDLNTIFRLKK